MNIHKKRIKYKPFLINQKCGYYALLKINYFLSKVRLQTESLKILSDCSSRFYTS